MAARLEAEQGHGIRAEDSADLLGDEVEDLLGARLAGDGQSHAVKGGPLGLLSLPLGDVPDDDEELVVPARDEAAFGVAQVAVDLDLPLDRLQLARVERPPPRCHHPIGVLSRDRCVVHARADTQPDRLGLPILLEVEDDPVRSDAEHLVGDRLENCATPPLARLQGPEVVVALDLERDCGSHLLEELGLVEESLVVHDRGERAAVALDRGHRPAGLGGELARPAFRVDAVSVRPRAPVKHLGARIVQQLPDSILHSHAGLLCESAADLGAGQPALQQPREEDERQNGDHDSRCPLAGVGEGLPEGDRGDAHREEQHHRRARQEDRGQRSARCRVRRLPATDKRHHHGKQEGDGYRLDDPVGGRGREIAVADEERAVRALVACDGRRPVEEQAWEVPEHGEHISHRDHAPLPPRLQQAARVGNQKMHEEPSGECRDREPERPGDGLVRGEETTRQEPREADRDHEQAGAVPRAARARDEPRRDERPARQPDQERLDERHRGVVRQRRRDDRERAGHDRRRHDDESETSYAHWSS